MLHKMAKWVLDSEKSCIERNEKFDLDVLAIKHGDGYILAVKVNGSSSIIVSSQREEKRVFKSLDTLYRNLNENGIHKLSIA